jgi:hypothetical protein
LIYDKGSIRAKDDTLRCAEKAGMGNGRAIQIVSEPEAAAAYAFRALEPLALNEGNNIVICDAGKDKSHISEL